MTKVLTQAIVAACLPLLFLIPSGVPASGVVENPVDDEVHQTASEAIASDSALLAESWGVSDSEARYILEAQEAVDKLDLPKLDADFVEIASNPGKDFGLTYLTTAREMSPAARSGLSSLNLEGLVSVDQVPFSREALSAAQRLVKRLLPESSADLWANIELGSVSIALTKMPSVSQIRLVESQVEVPLVWELVDNLASPTVPGGMPISVGNKGCTAGFVVEHEVTGNKGIATAGHCGTSDGEYNGTYVYFQSRGFGGNADVGWFDSPAVAWGARFKFNGSDTRDVTSRKSRAYMNIGDGICKYGKVTGYKCGEITNVTYCPSYVPNCLDTFFRLHNGSNLDISEDGDSGGPVFLAEQAWGFNSGETGSGSAHDALVMPQQFVGNLNVRVALLN